MNYRLNLFAVTLVFLVVLSVGLVPRSVSAQGMISGLEVAADRNEYLGPCPTEIKLRGKLQAAAPLGVVRYQFVHSDGTQSAVSQLAVNSKGVFNVEETLRKDASWNDTVFLRVFLPVPFLAPIPVDSNRITIKGECQTRRTVRGQESFSLGPPDVTESILSAPYTSAGTSGDYSRAVAATGDLYLYANVEFAGSIQKVAFISQTLPVERGIRRVRVSATLDPVYYYVAGYSAPPGYSSAEAIVNLRVMDGSRVVASDRISLWRLVTAVVGGGATSGSRPVTLRCEFTRPSPDDATTYTLIADIEGWAGAGGLWYSQTSVIERAHLQQFQVYLHRR